MLLPFVPDGLNTVLDVGCAQGWFGKKLKEQKKAREVWGVEFIELAIPQAMQNLDKLIPLKIEEALDELPNGHFDCIFFNDVLEHLTDPYTVLERIREKCSPKGRVVASIPNILNFEILYQVVVTQDWEYKDYGILDRTHLRFFTKKSIDRMFSEAGYHVSQIKGINEHYGRKFALLNFLLFNRLEQMKYVQWVVSATPKQLP